MPHRPGIGLAVSLLLAGAVLIAQDPKGPEILRPTDKSVWKAGPVSVVARVQGKGELRLDGKTIEARQLAPNALTATLNPAKGAHELVLVTSAGETKVNFFVGDAAPPGDFQPFRLHPPAAACETCHAVQNGAWNLKGETAGESCFTCHDQKPFAGIHGHNTEVLFECQMCHKPHGSAAAKHLKWPKEVACKQCHG
ncbi:MAG: cytochrome c3 family protein [Bryobacteraceae bacterium]